MTNDGATSSLLMYFLLALFLRSPSPANANSAPHALDTPDHRLILRPGRWKIRTAVDARSPVYFAYHFSLGFNWTELRGNYPNCSQVACGGLPVSGALGCDNVCSAGTLRDATIALKSATLEYDRAVSRLEATFEDLAGVVGARFGDRHRSMPGDDTVSKLLSHDNGRASAADSRVVDVMRHYRLLIDRALTDLAEESRVAVSASHSSVPLEQPRQEWSEHATGFDEQLDTWKSGAFKLAVQLNAVTFAFQGAHRRLVLCSQGIQRSDMTGCEPDFVAEYYTDTPVAIRALSSSRLVVLVVERETWMPATLSRWYMSFIDSSADNRTCWLDRPMVSNGSANYRLPRCDPRGICEPLELDDETVSACEVNEEGETSLVCPLVCGSTCFGPVCYQPQWDTYRMRSSSAHGAHRPNDLVQIRSPRLLSRVHSLSESDIQASLAGLLNYSFRSSELLKRGESLLRDIVEMDASARKYIDKTRGETVAERSRGTRCVDCERMISRSRFMAAASITLSALTCPLLIVLIVKLRASKDDDDVPLRTNASITENFL